MDPALAEQLPAVMGVMIPIAAIAMAGVCAVVVNWRHVRVAEQNAVLKKAMIDRGFSADEIVRVLTTESAAGVKMTGKPPELARTA